jgi:broad specificity phosphatase PhoE
MSATTTADYFNAYPLSQLSELKKQHTNVKLVHMIRHAEGTHNVNKEYKADINLDARLTEKGVAQCQTVADNIPSSFDKVDLILTSTMTRCVQTALYCFPSLAKDKSIPFVANEDIRETVNHTCDRRRPLTDIAAEYPEVDFSEVPVNEDGIWNSYKERLGSDWDEMRESAELHRVADRGRSFWGYLSKRSEQEVIVCTHSAFLRCTLSWGQVGGVEWMPPQWLDDRPDKLEEAPLLKYNGEKEFETFVRTDYANCELRSFCVVFE